MAKTKDEICALAAFELGLTAAAQATDGPTFGVLQQKFDGVLADLQGREIAAWGANETPDEVSEALSVYLAQKCLNTVGVDREVREYLRSLGVKPYLDVVAAAGRKWSGTPTRADRF